MAGAVFTVEEKSLLSNLYAQIVSVQNIASRFGTVDPATLVFNNQVYANPSWLALSKSFVGLGNVENTALSTWLGSNVLNTVADNLSFGGTAFLFATANTLSQRNGTTAQTLKVFNKYTGLGNDEWGVFDWVTSANELTVGTANSGTGTLRNVNLTGNNVGIKSATGSQISFSTGGAFRWWVHSSGYFYPNLDNAYDFGSTSNRLRNLYVGTNIFVGATSVGTSGNNVIAILNSTVPTTSPANTGQIYNDAGALKYRSPAGTVTQLAPN